MFEIFSLCGAVHTTWQVTFHFASVLSCRQYRFELPYGTGYVASLDCLLSFIQFICPKYFI